MHRNDAWRTIKLRARQAKVTKLLPHVPSNGDHRVCSQWRIGREHSRDGGSRFIDDDEYVYSG